MMVLVACGGGGGATEPSPPATPPIAVITAQPSDVSVQEGSAASFSVAADHAESFQWQRQSGGNWTDIAGDQARTLTLPVTGMVDHGAQFRVRVTGKSNTVTSSAATLSVSAQIKPALITSSPIGVSRFVGESASFSVTATGTDLSYRWQRSVDGNTWNEIVGATLATLNLPALALGDHGTRIRVLVSNSLGSVASEAALLVVEQPPLAPGFTVQPMDLSVEAGQAASFSIVAVGRPAPSLRWQLSRNGGASWTDIDGATQASYTWAASALEDDGMKVRALAVNPNGSATSAMATLQVRAKAMAPVVITQPQDLTVGLQAEARFTFTLSGSPTPTVQWQQCIGDGCAWVNIAGATNLSYTLSAARMEDDGRQYRAVLSNAAGTTTTRAARLTVDARARLALVWGEIRPDGHRDGALLAAHFDGPDWRIIKDRDGNLLVADNVAHVIRKIDLTRGQVSTIAGQPYERGSEDGDRATARLEHHIGSLLGSDALGNVYITEQGGKRLRKLSTDGRLTTLPFNGFIQDPVKGPVSSILGRATADAAGNVYVGGWAVIFKIDPAGVVTQLAGKLGELGSQDGIGAAARFTSTENLTMVDGVLVVAEADRLRRISLQGEVTTTLGATMNDPEVRRLFYAQADDGRFYTSVGPGTGISHGDTLIAGQRYRSRTAWHGGVGAPVVDSSGAILMNSGSWIIRIDRNGVRTELPIRPTPVGDAPVRIASIAVRGAELLTLECAADGPPVFLGRSCTFAVFSHDGLGNTRQLTDRRTGLDQFVPSADGHIIVNAEASSSVFQLQADGSWKDLRPSAPSNIDLASLRARAVDAQGNIYSAGQTQVYKTSPDGQITLFAGHETLSGHVDGSGRDARFSSIGSMTIDAAGALYLQDNHRIRRIAANGEVTSVLGRRGEPFMRLGSEPRLISNKMLGRDGDPNLAIGVGGHDELIMADPNMVLSAIVPGVKCDCGTRALRSDLARLRR